MSVPYGCDVLVMVDGRRVWMSAATWRWLHGGPVLAIRNLAKGTPEHE